MLSAVSCRTRRSPTRTTCCSWTAFKTRTLPPAEERTGTPGHGHRHAKPQALPQGRLTERGWYEVQYEFRNCPPGSRSRTSNRIAIHLRLSQGPSSRHRLEIATTPAGFTRPVAQPSAQRPPAASGGPELAGRQTPTSAHACFNAGNGEERGRTQQARNPAMLPPASPQPHRVHRRLSQGSSSRHHLETATAPAGFTRPVAQPSDRGCQ